MDASPPPMSSAASSGSNTAATTSTANSHLPSDRSQVPRGSYIIENFLAIPTSDFSNTVKNSVTSLASHTGLQSSKDKAKTVEFELIEQKSGDPSGNKTAEKDKIEANDDETSNSQAAPPTLDLPPPVKQPLHLLTLPGEIQFLILENLTFGDVEMLRLTCKRMRAIASPRRMRLLWGDFKTQNQLISHCKQCMAYDDTRKTLLLAKPGAEDYPLSSLCTRCALKQDDKRLCEGAQVIMANLDKVWICRWCRYPVVDQVDVRNEQFHASCYRPYARALLRFFVLGWIQLAFGITGASLAWHYYRNAVMVFAPTVTGFLLLWLCLGFLMFRSSRRHNFPYTLVLELILACLWIPPIYYISMNIVAEPEVPVPSSIIAALVFFGLNLFFRVVNVLGNIVLICKFDMTRIHRPEPSLIRKILHPFMAFFVVWTYPQVLDFGRTRGTRPRT